MTSIERNKALVERYVEMYRTSNLSIADAIIAADFVDHSHPEAEPGPAGVKMMAQQTGGAFTNLSLTVHQLIAERDYVAFHFTLTGVHTGPVGSLAASGRQVTIHGIDLFRVVDGMLAELWSYQTTLDMLRQMGYSVAPAEERYSPACANV